MIHEKKSILRKIGNKTTCYKTVSDPGRVNDYLVYCFDEPEIVSRVKFLQVPGANGIKKFSLEQSDDLEHWTVVLQGKWA